MDSLLSISEMEGRLGRQSGSLLGPGRQQCGFLFKPFVLLFNYREARENVVLIYFFR